MEAGGTAAVPSVPHGHACGQLKQAAAECPCVIFPSSGRHSCTSLRPVNLQPPGSTCMSCAGSTSGTSGSNECPDVSDEGVPSALSAFMCRLTTESTHAHAEKHLHTQLQPNSIPHCFSPPSIRRRMSFTQGSKIWIRRHFDNDSLFF